MLLVGSVSQNRQAIEKLENGKVNPTVYSLLEVERIGNFFV
jgi:DNA-binding XRE family transcriptional regulator